MAYTREQQQMIQLALRLSRGDDPRVRRALLEAMSVESSFRNLNYGDRDSQGVLQQRPSTGWGPPGNATIDIQQFLGRARGLARGFRGTPGQLAQAVQHSAFPGRYDQRAGQVNALLGGTASVAAGAGQPSAAPAPADTRDQRAALVQALVASSQQTGQHRTLDSAPILSALEGLRQARQRPTAGLAAAPPARAGSGGLPRGGPSLAFLTPFAHRFGLQITSTTGGKHVAGSYHYKRRAEDYGGDPSRMMALMQYALHHPRQFKEAFYDPAGFYVKDGRVYRGSIGGHRDHVHLAR